MKAIIPVAGAGTRLRPHTYTQPKALIPIAGKTILSFIVDQLHDAGINEFVFVIGHLGEKIEEFVKNTYPTLDTYFVYQNDRRGIGHAIQLAKEIVGNDEVFVTLGDTICDYDVRAIINSPYSMLGIKKVDDPRNFGVATVNDRGFIEQVVEKPAIPKSNIALVGLYKIKETEILYDCFQSLYQTTLNSSADFNLTDAIHEMIVRGVLFQSFKVKQWYDCGKKDTLLSSNATLLKKSGGNTPINHGYRDTIIIPPVAIAPGCQISNSIIGPHVAIGANTQISHSIVKESIIGSYTTLFEVVLDNSLIGSDASITGLSRKLNIGDNTEIDFG